MTYTTSSPRRVTRIVVLGLTIALLAVLLPVEPVDAHELAPATRSAVLDDLEDHFPDELDEMLDGEFSTAATQQARTSELIAAPLPFVGLGLRGTGDEPEIHFRTLDLDGEWSDWIEVGMLDGADGPDPDTEEAAGARPVIEGESWVSDAVWAGASTHLQLRVDGADLQDLEVTFIDTAGLSETVIERASRWMRSRTTQAPAEASTLGDAPKIQTRKDWGADESWRSGTPRERTIKHAVIHHTVTKNDYTRAEAPQQVRNMYYWHTQGNGWNDLGYNFVVDRFGTIYEGRYGGIDKGIQGAHAAGWNSASFGVAVMGNYNDVDPTTAALDSAAALIAWKYAVHGLDPDPAARTRVNDYDIRTLEGHRNVRSTYIEWKSGSSFQYDCPGFNIAWRLPQLRDTIAERYAAMSFGPFVDVGTDHPFYTAISWMLHSGLSEGYEDGTFRPTWPVTRQAAAAFLYSASGSPAVTTSTTFSDVGSKHPFHDEIAWMVEAGLAEGFPDGTYRPTEDVTRQAAAAFLYRAAGEPKVTTKLSFSDVPPGHEFYDAVAWMVEKGVAKGYKDGTFRPSAPVTRQAMAAFLHNADANGALSM